LKSFKIALGIAVSLLASCSHESRQRAAGQTTIFLDDVDSQDRDGADKFATAFALDRACEGVKLVRYSSGNWDNSPHWRLYAQSGKGDYSNILLWEISRDDNTGKASRSETSPDDAAHHVCAIVKQKGGQVD
jgi:hypothetical protein